MVKYRLTIEEQIKENEEIVEKYPNCKIGEQRAKYVKWLKALLKLRDAFNNIEVLENRIKTLKKTKN